GTTFGTPLSLAFTKSMEMFKLFIEVLGDQLVCCACTSGEEGELLDQLLASGLDVNTVNEAGDTPLHIVAAKDDAELAKILLKYNANCTVKNHKQQTAFDIAQERNNAVLPVLKNS